MKDSDLSGRIYSQFVPSLPQHGGLVRSEKRCSLRHKKKILPGDKVSVQKNFPRFYEKCLNRRNLKTSDDAVLDRIESFTLEENSLLTVRVHSASEDPGPKVLFAHKKSPDVTRRTRYQLARELQEELNKKKSLRPVLSCPTTNNNKPVVAPVKSVPSLTRPSTRIQLLASLIMGSCKSDYKLACNLPLRTREPSRQNVIPNDSPVPSPNLTKHRTSEVPENKLKGENDIYRSVKLRHPENAVRPNSLPSISVPGSRPPLCRSVSDNPEPRNVDRKDLEALKATAERLRLNTRPASYQDWLSKLSQGDLFSVQQAEQVKVEVVEEEEITEEERRDNLQNAVKWLRNELTEMIQTDQRLARQLMQLRLEIQKIRLNISCSQHQAMVEEVTLEMEDRKDQTSELCDLPLDSVHSKSPLRDLGVTKMNITNRRFSLS